MNDPLDSPVLVTGGTGFLGSHLVDRLLAGGRDVTVVSRQPRPGLSRRGVRVVVGALHEAAICAEAVQGTTSVFHVAARVGVWGRYQDYHRDNVIATETLIAAARAAGVSRFIHTSSPSVVYNGHDLAGVDESLPLTQNCPSPYPLTKAQAEAAVMAANRDGFLTTALRPHLIWGIGDPHLVPRILAQAQTGRLRIVGHGENRVDMVHIANATQAHLDAEAALGPGRTGSPSREPPAGQAYFITNGEPLNLWHWINDLLRGLGQPPIRKSVALEAAYRLGFMYETLWRILPLPGEPPLTRFLAAELGKDHWFDIRAAERDLGYRPTVSMAQGTAALIEHLRSQVR